MAANDPAFPVEIERPAPFGGMVTHPGLTKREWFAGQCNIDVYTPIETFERAHGRKASISELAAYIAEIRFIEADAMLAADALLSASGEGE